MEKMNLKKLSDEIENIFEYQTWILSRENLDEPVHLVLSCK